MNRRTITSFGCALLAMASAHAADLTNVTAGVGTKDVHLGMKVSAVDALLGEAPLGDAALGRVTKVWTEGKEKKPLVELYGSRGEANEPSVKQITFFAKGAQAGKDIKVGATVPAALFKGDHFTKTETLANGMGMIDNLKEGIAIIFSMDKEHLCQAIVVHEKNVEPHKVWFP